MTSVKYRKELLEKLQKQFENLTGKKLTEQEILNMCLEFSNNHLAELIEDEKEILQLTPELKKSILSNTQDCKLFNLDKTDDELIYGIKKD